MATLDYSTLSPQEIGQAFLQLEPKKIQHEISKLAPSQIKEVITTILGQDSFDWKAKLQAAFLGMTQREQLEACGKALNLEQAQEILQIASTLNSEERWKLLPLIVGLSPRIFEQILNFATPEQVQILKDEGISEPIQHHLTVLLHEWAKDIENNAAVMHSLLREVSSYDVKTITNESLEKIKNKLIDAVRYYQLMEKRISSGLTVAWNTNRSDLIEKMTALKDSCLKYINVVIGQPTTSHLTSTGLYGLLENQLNLVFGKNDDEDEPLEDSDPSIEGLSKLGIWYLHDYWEIGLLPGIEKPIRMEDEEHLLNSKSDKEQAKYRERLYFLAVENLERVGLATIKDLKLAEIYSKSMLSDFLAAHKNKLKKK